tara:strand:+ start:769 stop:1188 length:420 start_codon:yes stop_codon:yes gene_type:complete
MDIEQLNYDFGCIEDKTFEDIRHNNIIQKIDLKPEMFDYMIGDKTSLRYEHIKSIEDVNEKLEEMTKLLSELLPVGLPDEFYDWYARECLGLQYTKFQIKDRKRKYKIQRKRELEKKKQEDKLKNKRLQYTKKNTIITF